MHIYCISNSVTGKLYVGQSVQPIKTRWRQHCLLSGKCRVIESAIKKYGAGAFSIKEIAVAESQEELDRLEQFWIARLNTISPNGYNLSGGGNGAGKMHDETKALMREIGRRPERIAQMAEMRNRPEVRAKQTAGKIERWRDPLKKEKYLAAIKSAFEKPEFKQRKRESCKAAWAVPENRSVWLRGLQETQRPEAKAKRAASMIRAWNEPGARGQRGAAIRAAKSTPEAKARYAATNALPEVKARRSAANTGRIVTAETRLKKSLAATGKKRGPYKNCKPRPAMAAKWADPEWKAALLAKRAKAARATAP